MKENSSTLAKSSRPPLQQSQRILDAHSRPKLRDLSDTDKLCDMIHNWSLMMGIKESLSHAEKMLIVNFLKNNFSDLSVGDITVALELAAAGDFAINPEHYQSFSIVYIGGILNAYKTRLSFEIQKQQQYLVQGTDTMIPDAEKNKYSYDHLVRYFNQHHRLPVAWDWFRAYRHMEDSGMVDESDEVLSRIAKGAKLQWESEVRSNERNQATAILGVSKGLSEFKMKKYLEFKFAKEDAKNL